MSESFFQETDLVDLRETLIIYIIELLHERSSSCIYKNTTDTFIDELDPIWAYLEYYNIYIADQDNNNVSLVLLLDIPDVRNEIKSARDQLALMQDDDLEQDSISFQTNDNTEDVHMFYPGFDENENVNEEHKITNTLFLNTMQYHRDNFSQDSEDMGRDITSIIGILRDEELEMISRQALCFLLQCYNRLGGDDHPIAHFLSMDPSATLQELKKIHSEVNTLRTHKGVITDMTIPNLSKRSLQFVSK